MYYRYNEEINRNVYFIKSKQCYLIPDKHHMILSIYDLDNNLINTIPYYGKSILYYVKAIEDGKINIYNIM